MKILLAVVISVVLLAIVTLFVLGYLSKSGEANGLADGRLTRCPDTPNCVCSEYATDTDHSIEPLVFPEETTASILSRLKDTVREMGGVMQAEKDNYFAATFASPVFGFVDDLEIRIDTDQKLIHLRSASRVGHGDGGANRKRVEWLKSLFNSKSG